MIHTFDPQNKIITIEEVGAIECKQLLREIREWEASPQGMSHSDIVVSEGNVELPDGSRTPRIITFKNGWRLDAANEVSITGGFVTGTDENNISYHPVVDGARDRISLNAPLTEDGEVRVTEGAPVDQLFPGQLGEGFVHQSEDDDGDEGAGSGANAGQQTVKLVSVRRAIENKAVLQSQANMLASVIDDLIGPDGVEPAERNRPTLGQAMGVEDFLRGELLDVLRGLRDELRRLNDALEASTVDSDLLEAVKEQGNEAIDKYTDAMAGKAADASAQVLGAGMRVVLEGIKAMILGG